MAVSIEYLIETSPEYANVPVVYRVLSLDGALISKEYAKLEEIAANPELQEEYFSLVKEHFEGKTLEVFSVDTLSELDVTKLFELRDCLVYLMQTLSDSLNAVPLTQVVEQ
jgi:hypothetical protein